MCIETLHQVYLVSQLLHGMMLITVSQPDLAAALIEKLFFGELTETAATNWATLPVYFYKVINCGPNTEDHAH